MEHIAIAEFKAHCLEVIKKIDNNKIPIIITKRGKPVAQVIPIENSTKQLYGFMKDCMRIDGDIIEPIEEIWEVDE